jgi:hypothetical protein
MARFEIINGLNKRVLAVVEAESPEEAEKKAADKLGGTLSMAYKVWVDTGKVIREAQEKE